jgi:hypothetical protein
MDMGNNILRGWKNLDVWGGGNKIPFLKRARVDWIQGMLLVFQLAIQKHKD